MGKRSLNEIEDQIAQLEAQLNNSDSGESDSDKVETTAGGELERIPPLPDYLKPEFYLGKHAQPPPPLLPRSKHKKKKSTTTIPDGTAGVTDVPAAGDPEEGIASGAVLTREETPACSICKMRFTSDAQLDEHLKGKKHSKAVRAAQGPPSKPSQPPLPSQPQGLSCAICRKTFTSEAQLEEHCQGKWHKMRLSGELPRKDVRPVVGRPAQGALGGGAKRQDRPRAATEQAGGERRPKK